MADEKPFFAAGAADQPPEVEEVVLSPATPSGIQERAIAVEVFVAKVGVVVGGLAVLGGIVVFVLGLSEAVQWEFTAPGISSKVQTSAAGIVIAIIGVIVIALTRPKIRVHEDT